jgi:hypothetical protein
LLSLRAAAGVELHFVFLLDEAKRVLTLQRGSLVAFKTTCSHSCLAMPLVHIVSF